MEAQHMSQQTFANFIGMSAASLSSIFNNRTKPTLNTVEAIKSKIPNLSTDWLMFGRGSMFEESHSDGSSSPSEENASSTGDPSFGFNEGGGTPDLFSHGADSQQRYHDQMSHQQVQRPHVQNIQPEIRYVDRPQRQITEIRIYFDDSTYETFVPKK